MTLTGKDLARPVPESVQEAMNEAALHVEKLANKHSGIGYFTNQQIASGEHLNDGATNREEGVGILASIFTWLDGEQ